MRAIQQNLALCEVCHTLTDRPGEDCTLCGKTTRMRRHHSLQRVWALWLAGIIAYIPGNLYPVMVTRSVTGESASTILGGVEVLVHHGSYGVAAVIFIFSVAIPLSKFAIIAWLALSIQHGWNADDHQRHRAYEIVEFVGRWSMIDVFVVATLAALIQIGGLMTIKPDVGVSAFALSVIFTVLSAGSLDPRLIWDSSEPQGPSP